MIDLFNGLVSGDPWAWLFVSCVAVGFGIVLGAHCVTQEARGFVP